MLALKDKERRGGLRKKLGAAQKTDKNHMKTGGTKRLGAALGSARGKKGPGDQICLQRCIPRIRKFKKDWDSRMRQNLQRNSRRRNAFPVPLVNGGRQAHTNKKRSKNFEHRNLSVPIKSQK